MNQRAFDPKDPSSMLPTSPGEVHPTMSKKESGYKVATSYNETCGNCSMFRADGSGRGGVCTLVIGRIFAGDTCDYWEAKEGK